MHVPLQIGMLFLGAAIISPLCAETIKIDFQGVISESNFTSVGYGDTFTGSVFYSVPDTPLSTGCNVFCTSFYAMPEAMEVSVNGSSVYSANLLSPDNYIQVSDSNGSGEGSSIVWSSAFYELGITGPLAGERSSAFDILTVGFDGPSSVLGTTQIPEIFPALEDWQGAFVNFGTFSGYGADDKGFEGNISSIDTSVVTPEPSALPCLTLAFVAGCFFRRFLKRRQSQT